MKPLLKLLSFCVLGSLALAILLAVLLLQTSPSVQSPATYGVSETRQLEQIIVDNSPSRFSSSGEAVLRFDAEELNLLAGFAAQNFTRLEGAAAEFQIADSLARVNVSLPWPGPESPFYVNLDLQLAQQQDRPGLVSARVGRLPLPHFLTARIDRLAIDEIEQLAETYPELGYLRQSVQHVALEGDTLNIHLNWQSQQLTRLRDQAQFYFIEPEDRDRILYYYNEAATLAETAESNGRGISLHSLIVPLFASADTRSRGQGDPVAENRSLLQALSLYVNALDLELLVSNPPATSYTSESRTVTLHRRADLAQHFVSSSAIAASAGVGIAEILSNSKEVYDARYRTGFSFSDMTANAAGMMLGTLATNDRESAARVQQLLVHASSEADYMPDVSRDMRGFSEQDFAAEFNDRSSPDYLSRLKDIEQQIAVLPIYTQGIQ